LPSFLALVPRPSSLVPRRGGRIGRHRRSEKLTRCRPERFPDFRNVFLCRPSASCVVALLLPHSILGHIDILVVVSGFGGNWRLFCLMGRAAPTAFLGPVRPRPGSRTRRARGSPGCPPV